MGSSPPTLDALYHQLFHRLNILTNLRKAQYLSSPVSTAPAEESLYTIE